jgi:hypothetical protein
MDEVTVFKSSRDFHKAVDALHKQHIENGEAITREEVEKEAWNFLTRAVWELEENLTEIIENRGQHRFNMYPYEPREVGQGRDIYDLEQAKTVAQQRTDLLGYAHKVVHADGYDMRTQAVSKSYWVLSEDNNEIKGEVVFVAKPVAHA